MTALGGSLLFRADGGGGGGSELWRVSESAPPSSPGDSAKRPKKCKKKIIKPKSAGAGPSKKAKGCKPKKKRKK